MADDHRIAPMRATPSARTPDGPGWVHELKWDGMRAIVEVRGGRVRAHSTRGNDVTAGFPELGPLADAIPLDAVLDGELVALDEAGRPSFAALQQRIHLTDAATVARRATEVPVVYVVFDLLRLDGHDVTALAWSERRRLLEQVVGDGPTWRLTEVHRSGGPALLDAVAAAGLEGVVAKRTDAPYLPGRRSDAWVKVKTRLRQDLVVGGWLSGEAPRAGRVAALLVGHHDHRGLRYAGSVGSGLTEAFAERFLRRVADTGRAVSPFVDAVPRPPRRTLTWVEPTVVVEVAFSSWTAAGRLRHPVLLGERPDVDPATVTRDPEWPGGPDGGLPDWAR